MWQCVDCSIERESLLIRGECLNYFSPDVGEVGRGGSHHVTLSLLIEKGCYSRFVVAFHNSSPTLCDSGPLSWPPAPPSLDGSFCGWTFLHSEDAALPCAGRRGQDMSTADPAVQPVASCTGLLVMVDSAHLTTTSCTT